MHGRKIITQKQLKKMQNMNTETKKEEKGNWGSKRLWISKYRVAVISILSSVSDVFEYSISEN